MARQAFALHKKLVAPRVSLGRMDGTWTVGAGSMIGIAVFLGLVAAAAGVAFWNERRSPGWQAPRERQEPRFPAPSR